MKIFLVRHGESTQNTGDNYRAKLIDANVPLTEKGISQAADAGTAFAKYINKSNIRAENIRSIHSPYLRAVQTEGCFWESAGIQPICCEENILLTEQQWGLFDSVPEYFWEVINPYAAKLFQRSEEQSGKFWKKPFEGESPFDVYMRAKMFVSELKQNELWHSDEAIVLFTHGCTMRCIVMALCGYTVDWYENNHNPKNGAVWVLETNKNCTDTKDFGYIM